MKTKKMVKIFSIIWIECLSKIILFHPKVSHAKMWAPTDPSWIHGSLGFNRDNRGCVFSKSLQEKIALFLVHRKFRTWATWSGPTGWQFRGRWQRRSGTRCLPAQDFCPASRFFFFIFSPQNRLVWTWTVWRQMPCGHHHLSPMSMGMWGGWMVWVKCRAQFGLVWTVGDLFPLFPRQLLADYEVEILMSAEIVHFPYFHWIFFFGGGSWWCQGGPYFSNSEY